ncbi:unnamed protein product [Rhizoctonia solani]|uniref:TPX2 C-terminal domain-containing protein n=1 Tax=Rhizoctonia solani TaxID=456999 RepID=A0A8H3BIC4_9AGAM|nr:unnamed protein product [Rhizoctonia solani]
MPREVFLEPSGSPFVQSTPFNYDLNQSIAGDSTLTDLSFQDNDNLLNASAFAGLADVTAGGIGDETSMMKMQGAGNESEDMLMGVKGDEFLADDSMAFELSKSTTATRTRSKLGKSTTVPPVPAPAPVEEEEKPKRKKSTRSRSSSPSKKRSSAATTPVVEEVATFPVAQMGAMPEEPEPEPEPETKLRRSPRKARSTSTRLGSSVSTGISPFASTSSQPPAQPTPEKTPEASQPDSSPAPETTEPEPEPKTKRSSRVVGRSKSKSRAKSAKVEEPLNEESPKAEEPAPTVEPASTPVVEREVTPVARETTPIIALETTPILTKETTPVPQQHTSSLSATTQTISPIASPPATSPTPQIPIQATPPAASQDAPPTSRPAPTTRQSLAPVPTSQPAPAPTSRQSLAPASTTRQSLAPTPASRQSLAPSTGPTPFKFNLPPSFGRRTQSLAPTPATPGFSTTLTPSFPTTPGFPIASTPTLFNPVSALPSPAHALATPGPAIAPNPAIASDPSTTVPEDKGDDLKYEQLSKEEEEEAIAAAMRITRRDSSIFAGLMSPLRPSLVLEPSLGRVKEQEQEGSVPQDFTPQFAQESTPQVIQETSAPPATQGTSIPQDAQETSPPRDIIPTEPAPVPKRTRVGRGSTRVRGGAGAAVAVMGRVAEDMDVERVEVQVEPQGQERERAPVRQQAQEREQEQEQEFLEEEKQIIEGHQDVAIPVNFGSRSPSPTPPPPPPEDPTPSVPTEIKPKPSFATRTTRTTRASMSATQPARTTRSTRRSEVQPPTSRGLGTTHTIKETLIEKPTETEGVPNDGQPIEDVSTPTRAELPSTSPDPVSTTPLDPIPVPHDIISTTPIDSPVVSNPEAAPQKALGTKGSQRVATRTASAAGAPQRNVSGSGSSQSQPHRTASATHKPTSSGSVKPPSTGSTKPPSTDGPQRAAQKPVSTKPTASRKPSSTANKLPLATQKEGIADKEPSLVPDPDVPKDEPEPEVRAVRALPKRASRSSKVPTIMEDSMEISRDEISELDTGAEQTTPVQNTGPVSASIWPREPAPNPFAPPVNVSVVSNDDSPRTNKRRAPSPEPELEATPQTADANDSPNKRVRFSATLEAGPTPGIGRVLKMPKPSLKRVKKIKIERKAINANRAKRVLTRDWVVGGDMPSYAAPLRRDARERGPVTVERPPLVESQANTRATTSKLNPTVPIPFTFRSELRMKSHSTEEPYLPAGIPIATPMPDFAAAHAAAEAANLARRQRAHEAFLAAQAELESYHNAKNMIGGETARRAAERAVFDAATKVREAEAERIRNEQKKLEAEKDAADIREMRRRMVPKANPVPGFYKHAPRSDAQDLEA